MENNKLDINNMFPLALKEIQSVVLEGEKVKALDSWRDPESLKVPCFVLKNTNLLIAMHWGHAKYHINNGINGVTEENLSHAVTNCLMALQLLLEEE